MAVEFVRGIRTLEALSIIVLRWLCYVLPEFEEAEAKGLKSGRREDYFHLLSPRRNLHGKEVAEENYCWFRTLNMKDSSHEPDFLSTKLYEEFG